MTASPTPVPRTLYVHDDLSEELAASTSSRTRALGRALLALVRRDAGRVVVLTVDGQIDGLIARGAHPPFAEAVGIGAAGVRVAEAVHARTGWFPAIRRVDLWREEAEDGGYVLSGPAPLGPQLGELSRVESIAVVDDTIFSGLTMRTMLAALPPGRRHAFCLRAVAESLPAVAELAPVTAGFAAPGRILEDVSFINASGLVRRGAIRRAGRAPLAFYERAEWMAAWFPGRHAEITALCRDLALELERRPSAGVAGATACQGKTGTGTPPGS